LIRVRALPSQSGWSCGVQVEADGRRTDHTVGVSAADLEKWGKGTGRRDAEDLVRRSFEFLLEREPAASILRRFDLPVIERYFPEFDQAMRR
jgi:hypothetical protein